MSWLLAIETSSAKGSCALFKSEKLVAESLWPKDLEANIRPKHSDVLNLEVQKILESQGINLDHIDALALGLGPGSFTGLRVATNFVRSLSYLKKCPVYLIDSLSLLAQALPGSTSSAIVGINAYQNKVYVGHFTWSSKGFWQIDKQPYLVSSEAFCDLFQQETLYIGDLEKHYPAISNHPLFKQFAVVRSEHFAQARYFQNLLFKQGSPVQKNDWTKVLPLYLKSSEAEEKLKLGQLKPVEKLF